MPLVYQWQSNNKIDKVEIIGTVGDAFLELKRFLKDFLLHTYVKRKQSKYMKNLISGVNKKKVLLQVDFSENASITSQNEVQSAHWSHGSTTVGVKIKFPYRLKKNVLRRPNILKTVTVYRFYGVYTVTIFTRRFSSNSAQIHQ